MFTDCKVYEYEGHEIVAFFGRRNRYLKVDGEVVDADSSILKCTLRDGTQIEVRKRYFGKIIFKINDKMYFKEKT